MVRTKSKYGPESNWSELKTLVISSKRIHTDSSVTKYFSLNRNKKLTIGSYLGVSLCFIQNIHRIEYFL